MTHLAEQHVGVSSEVVGEGTQVITLDGDFDIARAPRLEHQLSAALAAEQTDVVVDLRGVRFLDSALLRLLVRGRTRAQQRGTRFALIRPHARAWRVFVLTGLSQTFATYPSLREALLAS